MATVSSPLGIWRRLPQSKPDDKGGRICRQARRSSSWLTVARFALFVVKRHSYSSRTTVESIQYELAAAELVQRSPWSGAPDPFHSLKQ